MAVLSSRWHFLLLFATACFHSANASFLDILRDTIEDSIRLGANDDEDASPPPTTDRFYTEDPLANAIMMVDFVDTPLYLVALFKYRNTAVYEDGRNVPTNFSGFDADSIYTQAMFADIVPGVGGEAKFVANIQHLEPIVVGDNRDEFDNVEWNALAVIEFPSGVAFGKMLTNQRFQDLTPHKKAGLEYHAIFACELVSGSAMDAAVDELELDNSDMGGGGRINETVSREDAPDVPVSVVDLVDYKRYASYSQGHDDSGGAFQSGTNAASKYFNAVTPLERNYGMRTASIFNIKHSLMEGAPGWDQVRIQTYPSHDSMVKAREEVKTVTDSLYHLEAGANRVEALELSPVFFNSLGGNDQIGYYEACASEESVVMAGSMDHDLSALCP